MVFPYLVPIVFHIKSYVSSCDSSCSSFLFLVSIFDIALEPVLAWKMCIPAVFGTLLVPFVFSFILVRPFASPSIYTASSPCVPHLAFVLPVSVSPYIRPTLSVCISCQASVLPAVCLCPMPDHCAFCYWTAFGLLAAPLYCPTGRHPVLLAAPSCRHQSLSSAIVVHCPSPPLAFCRSRSLAWCFRVVWCFC